MTKYTKIIPIEGSRFGLGVIENGDYHIMEIVGSCFITWPLMYETKEAALAEINEVMGERYEVFEL